MPGQQEPKTSTAVAVSSCQRNKNLALGKFCTLPLRETENTCSNDPKRENPSMSRLWHDHSGVFCSSTSCTALVLICTADIGGGGGVILTDRAETKSCMPSRHCKGSPASHPPPAVGQRATSGKPKGSACTQIQFACTHACWMFRKNEWMEGFAI